MDAIERLPLEAAQEDTMIACEHRHRYELAAALLGDLRVLDLCCGSGYGTAILAEACARVTGVDNDMATIERAAASVARRFDNVAFEPADAVAFLGRDLAGSFDAVVCFEGLEHLAELELAIERLRELAEAGVRILVSLPNDKLSDVHNPYHVTQFGYDEAIAAFRGFPSLIVVPQFLAEGSLILPAGATDTEVELTLGERCEPEYANHFVFCAGFADEQVRRAHRGRMQLSAAPVFNRWSEGLKRGVADLRRENARLAREKLSQGGSAAATALQRVADSDERVAGLRHLLGEAEDRILELEAQLQELDPPPDDGQPAIANVRRHTQAVEATPLSRAPDEDPNSWDQRRRRAAEFLIPWIERTVPLAGKTVLEYGCGNAPVSCAFAARAERVIGVDIDAAAIELGRTEVHRRGIGNIELELHPLQQIQEAVAGRRGQVDVFLLYAVLEHLTIEERLAILELSREVVSPDGAIVVCETPNRLIYFDHHTARMPFFHLLEPELALSYRDHSPRAEIRDTLGTAAAEGEAAAKLALTRLGRGVSFHEFELIFGDLSHHVIASNYDTALFGERPVQPDEVILARYLERLRSDLAPVWSRYWLDLILSPGPVQRREPFLRPWSVDTSSSRGAGWTAGENVRLSGPGATLWVELPHPSGRLVVGSVTQDGRWLLVRARPDGAEEALASEHGAQRYATAYSTFTFDAPVSRIALSASDECEIAFVGYDD